MKVDVATYTIINRPITDVSRFSSNPDNAPIWYKNIKSVTWKTKKPLAIGSRIAFKAVFLGRVLEYVYEVVEMTSRKLVMKTAYGPFLMETSYTWSKVGKNQTRMIIRNKGLPKGFSILFTPIMSLAMRMANKEDLARLKEIMESEK